MRKRVALIAASTAAVMTVQMASGVAYAAKGTSAIGWSSPQAISPTLQPDPTRGSQTHDVAVNTNGVAVAAWDQFTYTNGGGATVGAAVQTAGTWGAPFTISGMSGFSMSPRVAAGNDGTLAVTWIYQDSTSSTANPQQKVQVAVRRSGSTGWTTTTLATGPVGGVAVTIPAPVVVDGSGNVTVAWALWDGSRHPVQTATMTGGLWSATTTVSGGADALGVSLALDSRGDAGIAYVLSAYSSSPGGTNAQYTFRPAGTGVWTAPVVVSETLPNTVGYVTDPHVALDANGRATIAYMGTGLEATRQAATGWRPPAVVVSSPVAGASFLSPDLGLDAAGNAVVAVSVFDPTTGVDRASVWVSRGTADGAWTPQQRLTDPTASVDAYATRVAVSPDGLLALVGWVDHYHGVIQASRLVNGTWAAAATIGRGTAFSSFQEVMGLDASSSTVARVTWKSAKTGTQVMGADFRG